MVECLAALKEKALFQPEVRLVVPGLNRANPVGDTAASLEQLLQQLRAAAEVASTFKLVLSDELALNRAALLALATKRGHEWTGPPLGEVEEGDYIGKFDLPLRALQARPRPQYLELLAKVVT